MGIRVNLGCGNHVLDGWENLDPRVQLDGRIVPWKWNDPLPFPDGSASVVLIQHSLQHCKPSDYDRNFAEVMRILEPGGEVVVKEADDRHYVWHSPGAKDRDGVIESTTSEPEMASVLERNGFVGIVRDREDIVRRHGGAINRAKRLLSNRNLFVVEGKKPYGGDGHGGTKGDGQEVGQDPAR